MNEKKYNTITLPQIFWKALSRWWIIVLCVIIGGVALYKYASRDYDEKLKTYETTNSANLAKYNDYNELLEFNTAYREASNGTEAEKAKKAEEMAAFSLEHLSSDQLIMINDALELKDQMEQVSNIKDELITARVNPYSIPVLSMIYIMSTEVAADLTTLASYYQSANDSRRIWTDLYQAMGYSEEEYSLFTGCTTFTINKERITLTLYYDNLDGLKDAKTSLQKVMEKVCKDVTKTSGITHELTLLESNIYTKSDTTIATQQNTYKQWILDYGNRLNSLKSIFAMNSNAIMSNYYEYLTNKADGGNGYVNVKDLPNPADYETTTEAVKPRNPKIMAIIGCMAGFVLGIAIIVLIMMFAGRLQKAEELPELFSLGLIGTLRSEGFILPFENLVRYLSTRRYGSFNVEKRIQLTAVKLQVLCESKNIKNIVISGTAANSKNRQLLEKLKSQLDDMGIKTVATGSILKSAEVFQKAAEAGNIVFVERETRSAYADINRELLMAGDCNIDILGSIYIY